MKRSEVNTVIKGIEIFFAEHHFMLPEWASWSPEEWKGMFINSIAAAWDYRSDELDDDFFNSDIVVSGGFACFYLGGTYFEEKTGEKRSKMEPYYDAYRKQIAG
jgi:D-lyxose ketol-isomerase